jgi:hypothetical protein
MKAKITNLVLFLTFSIGIPPAFSFNNVNMHEMLTPPLDSISLRLGSTRRLRSGDEAGIPKGRYNAKVIHQRGLCEDYFSTNCKGKINRNIDFPIGDRVFFKSDWIRKPLIVTNLLDSKDSTSLISSIEVSMNKSGSTRQIYGRLSGSLFDTIKFDEIIIYANDSLIGRPDSLGYYEAPTDENGKIKMDIVINLALVKYRANITTNTNDECFLVECEDMPLALWLTNECCNPTVTSLEIETGDDKRARIDIVYDDDRKKRAVFNKLNLMSIYTARPL